jgi:DNA-binding beta-propeller fold protein YncE
MRVCRTWAGTGVAGFTPDAARDARFNNPFGVVEYPDGSSYYVCDTGNHCVRRVMLPEMPVRVIAGTGESGYGGDGGIAVAAHLNEPYEARFDRAGDLYVVEMRNHVIRKVHDPDRGGVISTFAGTGKPGFAGDGGPATNAQFNQPHAIQFDPEYRYLYVCDIGNHRLRRIDMTSGVVTTFAGDGTRRPTPDGAKVSPSLPLNGPRAIDFDADGNLWLALREGNAVYRIDMKAGTIHHVAGTGKQGFTGNGGPAKAATLSGPKGISVGPDGNVYLADTESHSVRMIDVKRGTLELIAGTGEKGDGPDGDALKCRFARPHGIYVDRDGAILVGDSENHRVRVITRAP